MAYEVRDGYQKIQDKEPLILEPEDWTFDEWQTICKLCGLPAMTTERIVLHADVVECYINSDAKLVNSDSGKRAFTVTEVCPHCENEIEMRWSIEALGYKAVCPVCGKRLMLCDECLHAEDGGHCDYDSKTDSCKHNPAKNDPTAGESKRVVIVVEDGMVESVYAEDKLVDVEIVDKDSDDGDRRGWIDEAVKELHEDVASGKLVSVY